MKKFGDWAIALTVIGCSAVLFFALVFALQGNPFDRPSRTLRASFPDVTGIQASSLVKYAGAIAGNVHSVRMLTPEERTASPHPENAIELVLALNNDVPPLSEGLVASVASDTLLSDKFIVLLGGDPKAPALKNDAVVASITPVTFDAILRDLSGVLAKLRQLVGSGDGGNPLDGIMPKVDRLLDDLADTVAKANGLLGSGNNLIDNANGFINNGTGLIGNADGLVNDGRALIDANKDAITRAIAQLGTAATSLDDLARRLDQLVKKNEGNVQSILGDAKVTLSELKSAAITARQLAEQLRARPQSLLWGPGRPPKKPASPAPN